MRALLTCCFAAFVLCLTTASAQQTASTQTMTVYVSLPTSGDGGTSYKTGGRGTVLSEILVLATSNGQPSYSVKPGSTRYIGDNPAEMNNFTPAELNNLFARATVEQGVALGYNHPGATGIQTRVVDESNVSHNFSIRSTANGIVIRQESTTNNAGTIQ